MSLSLSLSLSPFSQAVKSIPDTCAYPRFYSGGGLKRWIQEFARRGRVKGSGGGSSPSEVQRPKRKLRSWSKTLYVKFVTFSCKKIRISWGGEKPDSTFKHAYNLKKNLKTQRGFGPSNPYFVYASDSGSCPSANICVLGDILFHVPPLKFICVYRYR